MVNHKNGDSTTNKQAIYTAIDKDKKSDNSGSGMNIESTTQNENKNSGGSDDSPNNDDNEENSK
eukprot:CAMPEP_0176356458 /NCGR_PEP_ID=MMETSP0126-20121128/14030_1 /TAXON_ID=141414 ORGANISM="Strombidinopsis acuminatum, Strain SPMC142" /NCGR_SAMPLE_ID=MMETSP0126 /ASSEMBLY_ACC=CAM_ASM_000229 /LENGTH=63 /DNA_ID=CAMNT_0017709559 /DNA_START=1753 /DNA_END=1944 /DNA_ORIENTATION=+